MLTMDAFALILVIVLAGLAAIAVVAWTLSGGWVRYTLQRTKQRGAPAALPRAQSDASARQAPNTQARRVVVPARAGKPARITSSEPGAQDSDVPTQPRAHRTMAAVATSAFSAPAEAAPSTPVANVFNEPSGDSTNWPSTSWHSTSWPATQPSSMTSISTQFAETMPMSMETTAAR